jgi:hypothetical protein
MATYFDADRLTDKVAIDYKDNDATFWNAVIAETDRAVVDLAETNGVASSDISTDDSGYVHTFIQEWARARFYYMIFEEAAGLNDIEDNEQDRYYRKFQHYYARAKDLEKRITEEMFTGNVCTRGDRVQQGILYTT